jgi:hypothetical protein
LTENELGRSQLRLNFSIGLASTPWTKPRPGLFFPSLLLL